MRWIGAFWSAVVRRGQQPWCAVASGQARGEKTPHHRAGVQTRAGVHSRIPPHLTLTRPPPTFVRSTSLGRPRVRRGNRVSSAQASWRRPQLAASSRHLPRRAPSRRLLRAPHLVRRQRRRQRPRLPPLRCACPASLPRCLPDPVGAVRAGPRALAQLRARHRVLPQHSLAIGAEHFPLPRCLSSRRPRGVLWFDQLPSLFGGRPTTILEISEILRQRATRAVTISAISLRPLSCCGNRAGLGRAMPGGTD